MGPAKARLMMSSESAHRALPSRDLGGVPKGESVSLDGGPTEGGDELSVAWRTGT